MTKVKPPEHDEYKYAGPTILERMRQELDRLIEAVGTNSDNEDGLDKGRIHNACYFIALMQNPYAPNINGVRDAAIKRWRDSIATNGGRDKTD